MGFTLNVMIFAFALALFLTISTLPPNVPASPLGQIITGQNTLLGTINNFFHTPGGITIFGAAVGIGVTFFPNMWAIFFLPTLAILGWAIFPANMFNSFLIGINNPFITDPNVGVFAILQDLFSIALILSVVSWYKGGGDL